MLIARKFSFSGLNPELRLNGKRELRVKEGFLHFFFSFDNLTFCFFVWNAIIVEKFPSYIIAGLNSEILLGRYF